MSTLHPCTEIVVGPPGCGKTHELLRQVEELLTQGVEPSSIGYYTFTRRAAEEAQDRAMARFGLRRADLPHFRTLHSECMRQVGLTTSQVLDGEEMQRFADWIGEEITGRVSMEDGFLPGAARGDRMLHMCNLARVRCRTLRQQYEEDHDELDWLAVERFDRGLREYKRRRGLVDFTDMLELFSSRGSRDRLVEWLFVDEAQDLSSLQWRVVDRLSRPASQVVVAGDDDQTIYRWAGADVDFLLGLDGSVRVLGQSHRVPRRIQLLARGILSRIHRRRPKQWAPREAEGRVTYAPDLSAVDWSGDVMVLARNQYHLESVRAELRSVGIYYEHHGKNSVRQEVIDAVWTWEGLRRGDPQDVTMVRRLLKQMGRGVGGLEARKPDSKIDWSEVQQICNLSASPRWDWHEALVGVPAEERAYMRRCRRRGELFSKSPRVRLGTIHDSKGSERDRVVLLTDMAPRTEAEFQEDPDSELRCWYVGVTRAREELTIVAPQTRRFMEI